MTFNKTRKATVAKISLAGLLITMAPSTQAINFVPSYESVIAGAKNAAYVAGFIALVRFFSRKPDNSPNRYNLDALPSQITSGSYTEAAKNCFYVVDDGIIGHPKESSVLKANPDNENKLEFTESVSQRGFLGTAGLYAKPVAIAYAVMEILRTKGDLNELFKGYSDKLATDGGKPFFAVIGALAAAKALNN